MGFFFKILRQLSLLEFCSLVSQLHHQPNCSGEKDTGEWEESSGYSYNYWHSIIIFDRLFSFRNMHLVVVRSRTHKSTKLQYLWRKIMRQMMLLYKSQTHSVHKYLFYIHVYYATEATTENTTLVTYRTQSSSQSSVVQLLNTAPSPELYMVTFVKQLQLIWAHGWVVPTLVDHQLLSTTIISRLNS